MNKVIPLGLMVSALLTGCGGGSDGGSPSSGGGTAPSTKYTWQMIHLYETARASVAGGCSIFDELPNGNVVAATLASEGYKILFHNADGSIISEHTQKMSDIPSSGKVTIDTALVPDGGYVSLEEIHGSTGSNRDVYMLTVQDQYLSDLVINVRLTTNSGNSCYTGEQYTSTTTPNSVLNVQEVTGTGFYQTSYIDTAVSGNTSSANIPVLAPTGGTKKALVTAYSTYNSTNQQRTGLTHYAFVDGQNIYDPANPPSPIPTNMLKSDDLINLSFTTSGLAVNDTNSSIQTVISNDIYQWQPIYEGSGDTSAYAYINGTSDISSWALSLNGTLSNSWTANYLMSIDENAITLDIPTVNDFSTTTISSGTNFALNSSTFNTSDFNIQRTHLRATTNNNSRAFYQTIFAAPNNSQVFMKSSVEELNVTNNPSVEASLGKLNVVNAANVNYFMQQSIDAVDIINGSGNTNFKDVNGVMALPSQEKSSYLNMMSNSYLRVENRVTL